MCTLSLIPKKKKNTFNGSLHGEEGGWNESNLIGWSRRHRANCKRFLQAGRGRKNKASAIEWPVIFKWTVATHPRVWNSVWLSRNIYLSSHCFHPSSLSQRNQSLALSLDESSNCFSPLPPHFSFSFLFLFFSHFCFLFSFFLSLPHSEPIFALKIRRSIRLREELKQQRLPFNARLQPLRLWIHPGSILTLLVQKPIYLDPRGSGF